MTTRRLDAGENVRAVGTSRSEGAERHQRVESERLVVSPRLTALVLPKFLGHPRDEVLTPCPACGGDPFTQPARRVFVVLQLGQGHGEGLAKVGDPLLFHQRIQHRHRLQAITDPGIRRGNQQAGQRVGEQRLIGVHRYQVGQPVARLLVPSQADEGCGVPERRAADPGVDADHLFVVRQRLVQTSGPSQDAGQPEAGLDVVWIGLHGRREAVDRFGVISASRADAEMTPRP